MFDTDLLLEKLLTERKKAMIVKTNPLIGSLKKKTNMVYEIFYCGYLYKILDNVCWDRGDKAHFIKYSPVSLKGNMLRQKCKTYTLYMREYYNMIINCIFIFYRA